MVDFIEKTKLYSKKRIALVFLSILKNNIVNRTLYYSLLTLESLQMVFISIIYAFLLLGTNGGSRNIWGSLELIQSFIDTLETC